MQSLMWKIQQLCLVQILIALGVMQDQERKGIGRTALQVLRGCTVGQRVEFKGRK